MPVIKSAKKKLRQDKKRTKGNKQLKTLLSNLIKKAEKKPTAEAVRLATQAADKAAKQNLIHKNNAAHIKSRLSKLINTNKSSQKTETPAKTAKKQKKSSPNPKKK